MGFKRREMNHINHKKQTKRHRHSTMNMMKNKKVSSNKPFNDDDLQNELRTKLNIGPLLHPNYIELNILQCTINHILTANQTAKRLKKRASAIGLLFKKISKPKRKNTEDITISTASSKN